MPISSYTISDSDNGKFNEFFIGILQPEKEVYDESDSFSEEFLDELFTEFSSRNCLICIEGTERFEFVDLPYSNMSEKRLKNVLLELIEERREEDCSVNNKSYRPLGRNRARSLITKIIRRVMTRNVVLAAFDSVPGWQRGIVTYSNEDVFVRRTMEPVTPVAEDWSNIRGFIESLFGSGQNDEPYAEEQLHAFYCLVQAKLLQMMGEPQIVALVLY